MTAHLVVLALGACGQLLVVLIVVASLVGAVLRDEELQALLNGIAHCPTDKGVLRFHANSDDTCLLVNHNINIGTGHHVQSVFVPR